jgi:predicted esterase
MSWMQFSRGVRLEPIGTRSPEALVVLLHDMGGSAALLAAKLARWATMVPATAFVALDGAERPEAIPEATADLPEPGASPLAAQTELTGLDLAARELAGLLRAQLRACRLDASALVLVGFGYGATLALHLVLRHGWRCAGVLAYGAKVVRPVPKTLRVGAKVRLIECLGDGDVGYGNVRDVVALLTDRGIDTRGALLAGSVFTDASIRHGGAYLVELVATAQRGGQFHPKPETRDAQ